MPFMENQDICREELYYQYKTMCKTISNMIEDGTLLIHSTNAKEIISRIMIKPERYDGIESLLGGISRAVLSYGIESIVE